MEHPKILAIDDLTDNLIVLEALLSETFPTAKILTAQSGASGIKICLSERPDLVMLDIIMPGMDGFEVCRFLKSNPGTRIIPVIMVTASKTNTEFRIKALDAGADAFLTKPFERSELTAQIRAMLRIKEAEDFKQDEKERLKMVVQERTLAFQNELQERILAEEALKLSERRFRYISSSISDISYSCTINEKGESEIDWLYGAVEKITGYTSEELREMKCWGKLVLEEDLPLFKKHIVNAKPETTEVCQLRIRTKEGKIVWIQSLAQFAPERLNSGENILYGGLIDITQQKLSEEKLRASESQFREFFEKAADAIFVADIDTGIIMDANEAATRLTQQSYSQLIGIHQSQLHPPVKMNYAIDTFNKHKELLRQKVNSHAIMNSVLRPDGTEVPVEIMASEITYKGKKCIMGTFRDITERQKAEELLRLSEERFRMISDSSTDIICSYDLNSRFTSANRTMCAAMNLSEKEIIGKTHKELHFPEAQCREWDQLHQRVLDSGDTIFAESVTPMPDGNDHIFEIALNPLYDSEKNIVGIGVVTRDITERKKSEQALRESQQLFHGLFNASPDAIVLLDPHHPTISWPIVDCNEAACRMNGYTREEMIGQSIDMINLTKGTPEERTAYLNMLRIEPVLQKEAFHRHKDGRTFPVEISTSIVSIGSKEMILGIDRDVTERKAAEKELSLQKQRLADILQGTNAGTWTWNVQTDEEIHNQRWFEIIGYKPEEFNRDGYKVWESNVHPDDLPLAILQLSKLRDGEIEFYDVEYRMLHKNGDWVWVNSRGKVVERDKDGKVLWISGTHLDITDRKNAYLELQQSQSTLRGILESFPGEIFWKDTDLNYLGCNKAFSISAGLESSEEIKGKNDFDLPWGDSTAELYRSMDRQVISTGVALHNLPGKQDNADGSLTLLNTSKIPLYNSDGQVIGILGVSHDVTEIKQTQESLQASNDLNSSLLNTIPFGMDIVDETGNILFQNSILQAMFGESALGKKCWELYRDDKTQCFDCPLHSGIHIGQTMNYETQGALGERTFQISHTGMMFQGKKAMLEIFQDVTEKRKAEKELEEINQRFSNLVETTDGIVWEADAESFLFSFISKNAERILGYPEQEWYQPNFWSKHILPEDWEKTVSFCVAQTRLISDHDFEYRFVTSDGRVVWLADYVKVIPNDGKPWKLNGLMVDITERKKMELALQKSEDRYRSFISQVSEGVYRFECVKPIDITLPVEEQIDLIYDHMIIAECNEAFLEMYKIEDKNSILGKGHLEFHGGRYHPVNRAALRSFVNNGYRIEDKITEETDSLGNSVVFSNNSLGIVEDGYLVRMWGTQINITQKVKDEQVQQLLYEISNAALSSIDLHDLIELICRGIEKLIDSRNFYIAFYDEKTNMLSTVYERDEKEQLHSWSAEKSMTGYVIRNQKSMIIKEEDTKRLVEANEIENIGTPSKVWLGVPMIVNGKVIGAIVVQNYETPDIYTEKDQLMLEFISNQISTSVERKRAEQEIMNALAKAKESDRLKSAFLANMSHEIRTPLNSIIGFSELLTDPDFDKEQQLEFAQMINDSGTNLLAILTDIMDISKIEAGQIEIKPVRFSLRRLVSDVQREYSYKAVKKGVEVRLNLEDPENETIVESDVTKLRQVLVNLVGNAVKFTSEGYIEIGVKTLGDQLRVQVKDTGIGIPEEYHDKIFERFRQVETSNTRKYGGNGLGLAISKSLIEMLGGTIGLESDEGIGSTFYFMIPISWKKLEALR